MSQLLPERRSAPPHERWERFGDLEEVTDRMRRMLDQTFGRFGWPSTLIEPAAWSPLVDIEETDDGYVVEAELPGVRREDVNIELVGNELAITGELKERERKGTVRRRTRRTGRFEYRAMLPGEINAEGVDANLNEGMLTVKVPKAEAAKLRRIEITAGD
jgi:HSP20 family protein